LLTVLRRFLGSGDDAEPVIDADRLPRHIAVIMDGNGRWAHRRRLPRIAGHRAGAKVVREIVKEAAGLGIGWLTLYAFSAENWRRPKNEVNSLMRLFEEILQSELEELHSNNIKIRVIGDLESVTEGTRQQFTKAVAQTIENTGLNLVIALNYGGRADILQAVNRLAEEACANDGFNTIDEARFSGALATAGIPDPELIIRTSGEMRLSNFLIWEGAYAEFWVTDTLWPDFKARDFRTAICDYQNRDRRFGGLSDSKEDAD
jgi:undecaprenyl diphosphate synthase